MKYVKIDMIKEIEHKVWEQNGADLYAWHEWEKYDPDAFVVLIPVAFIKTVQEEVSMLG